MNFCLKNWFRLVYLLLHVTIEILVIYVTVNIVVVEIKQKFDPPFVSHAIDISHGSLTSLSKHRQGGLPFYGYS